MLTKLISIGKASRRLGVSIDTLRRWDKSGRLQSVRSGPRGHRYYRQSDIEIFLRDEISIARQWVEEKKAAIPAPDIYCKTRDIFQARLEKFQSVLSQSLPLTTMSLITAIAGEIGNNSYDHNLGSWPDIAGIFFSYNMRNRKVVLADRGQGILKTLKRVRPNLDNAASALKVAFTETISGRQPEARGNGLKFVREVVINNSFTLDFRTGDAYLQLKQHDLDVVVKHTDTYMRGCFATIKFEDLI